MNRKKRGSKVVIYSAASCAHCRRAKAFMRTRGIAFREMDIGTNPRARKEFGRLSARGVPVVLIGGERLDGFDLKRLLALYED
ncbi:MAG: glutaredoxin family protein [Thiohalocapsa sp.]